MMAKSCLHCVRPELQGSSDEGLQNLLHFRQHFLHILLRDVLLRPERDRDHFLVLDLWFQRDQLQESGLLSQDRQYFRTNRLDQLFFLFRLRCELKNASKHGRLSFPSAGSCSEDAAIRDAASSEPQSRIRCYGFECNET